MEVELSAERYAPTCGLPLEDSQIFNPENEIYAVCQIDFDRTLEGTECMVLTQFYSHEEAVVFLNGLIDDLYLKDESIANLYKIYKLRDGVVDLYRQYYLSKVLETRWMIRKVQFINSIAK